MAAPLTQTEANKMLASVAPFAPSAPGSSGVNSPLPPQQFLAGGIGGIVTWFLIYGLEHWAHFDLVGFAGNLGIDPGTLQTGISGIVAAALVYLVPPSRADVVKNLNDDIVHLAQKDPDSDVSYALKPVQPPVGEPAVIVPPAKKVG